MELLNIARRFRLPGGTGVILGRDMSENKILRGESAVGTVFAPVNCPGPTALVPEVKTPDDIALVAEMVAAYSKCDRLEGDVVVKVVPKGAKDESGAETVSPVRPYDRTKFMEWQIC